MEDFGPYVSETSGPIGVRINFFGRLRDKLKVPAGAIREAYIEDNEMQFTKSNFRYVLSRNGDARIDLETGSVNAYLQRRLEDSLTPRIFAKWSVIRGLERKNRYLLHSSAVADGQHIRIFVGRSGAGKTTILMLHLLRGETLLTDDVLFLGNGTICPLPMRVNLGEEAFNEFKRDYKLPTRRLNPGLVDLRALFPHRDERVQLKDATLYYLRVWHSKRTKVQRVSRQRMLGLLTDSYVSQMNQSYWWGWKNGKRISNAMRAYAELLEHSNCYEIYAGSDLNQLYRRLHRTED